MASKIIGLTKLQKKLNRLPDAAKKQIRAAMEKSADEMVAMMKDLVPVDSGDLKQSIGWRWGKRAPSGKVSYAKITASKLAGDLTLTIYAGDNKAFYARWVEFGTVAHSVARGGGTVLGKKTLREGGGVSHPGATKRPFFFVSYRANKKRALSRIRRAITKSAKQVAAGK